MLQSFTWARNFKKLRVSVFVDCVRREADLSVTYDRRLIAEEQLHKKLREFTPEAVEAYFRENVPVAQDGVCSRLEAMEGTARYNAMRVLA